MRLVLCCLILIIILQQAKQQQTNDFISKKAIQELFELVDKNQDGNIDFEEFYQWKQIQHEIQEKHKNNINELKSLNFDQNKKYKIVSVASGKVLDVTGADQNNGAQIIIFTEHTNDNQKFIFTPTTDDYYTIKAVHSQKVLDITGGSREEGVKLIQYQLHGGENQQFKFHQQSDGSFGIECRHSGLYLDVYGGQTDDRTPIIQWKWHGGNNQRFIIKEA